MGVSIGIGDVPLAGRVCTHLDGLPLSLELAAAQLRQLSLAELVARLDSRFELLTRGRAPRRRRQDSLAVVLQDTWDMLTVSEQELLLQLAAFPAAFDADDIDAIASGLGLGVPSATLAGLVDRGVVSDRSATILPPLTGTRARMSAGAGRGAVLVCDVEVMLSLLGGDEVSAWGPVRWVAYDPAPTLLLEWLTFGNG
ncbi:MAG: hypothetical protein ACR2NL_12865 [Acidimicrobiia bacterium]